MTTDDTAHLREPSVPLVSLAVLVFLTALIQLSLISLILSQSKRLSEVGGLDFELIVLSMFGSGNLLGQLAGLVVAVLFGARKSTFLMSLLLVAGIAAAFGTSSATTMQFLGLVLSFVIGALMVLPLLLLIVSGSAKQIALGVPLLVVIPFVARGLTSFYLLSLIYRTPMNWLHDLVGADSPLARRFQDSSDLVTLIATAGVMIVALNILRKSRSGRTIALYSHETRAQALQATKTLFTKPANFTPIIATALLGLAVGSHVTDVFRTTPLQFTIDQSLWYLGLRIFVNDLTAVSLALGFGGIIVLVALRPWRYRSTLFLTTIVTLLAATLTLILDIEAKHGAPALLDSIAMSTSERLWLSGLSLLTSAFLATALALSWLTTLQMGRTAPIAALFLVVIFSRFLVPSGLDMIGPSSIWVSETMLAFVVLLVGYLYLRRNRDAWPQPTPEPGPPNN